MKLWGRAGGRGPGAAAFDPGTGRATLSDRPERLLPIEMSGRAVRTGRSIVKSHGLCSLRFRTRTSSNPMSGTRCRRFSTHKPARGAAAKAKLSREIEARFKIIREVDEDPVTSAAPTPPPPTASAPR